MKNTARSLIALVLVISLPQLARAQATAGSSKNTPAVGISVKASTLGIGVDAAVRVHPKLNIRGGFNFLSVNHNFENTGDNITYVGDLHLRSVNAYVDYFPVAAASPCRSSWA